MKFFKLALGLLCASALCLQAAPLQPQYVPANAVWFTHVDVDRLKETKVGQYILEQLKEGGAQSKIEDLKAIYGFDLAKGLHGVTVYGQDKKSENCVMLTFGDIDTQRFLTRLQANKGYQVAQVRGHKVYSWIDEKNPKKQRTSAVIIPGGVALSLNSQNAAGALDVLQGAQPSLRTAGALRELGLTGKSPFLVGAALPSALPTTAPMNLLLRNIESVAWGIGETNGQLEAEVPVRASSEKAAEQFLSADKGLVALLSFQTNNPTVEKILQGLSTKSSGSVVSTTLRLPVSDFLQMLENPEGQKK